MDSPVTIPLEFEDAPHPGDVLNDYLESFEWSQSELARRAGLTPKTISEICNGKAPITPNTALAFEKVFRRPAHVWLNLQRRHDEAAARRRARAQSTEWRQWASKFPIAAMRKCRFLPVSSSRAVDVDELLTYFSVSSPAAWKSVWEASHVAYRQTRKFKTSEESIAAWVRETEIEASKLEVSPYDEARLRASIPELRRLTLMKASTIKEPIKATCAAVGIAVVWVPGLPQTGISGCARWITSTRALIALTLRYKTDDQLWFTFFHELGHILLHRKERTFVLDNAADDVRDGVVDPQMKKYEDEANRFAADTLIPPDALTRFIRSPAAVGNDTLKAFSDDVGIAPGIVVGRLQHEGVLKAHQGNMFKQKLEFRFSEEGDSE